MTLRRACILAVILIVAGGYLRVDDLGVDPLRFDEAVNWHVVSTAETTGQTPYQIEHFHGPFYFRMLGITNGDSEYALRLPSVVCGLLLAIVAVVIAGRHFSPYAIVSAAALFSFDPIFIFYNRVAIHESLFALLAFVFAAALWFFCSSFSALRAVVVGGVLGLLAATKETFGVALVTSAAAILPFMRPGLRDIFRTGPLIVVGAYAAVAIVFGSLSGPFDLVRGVFAWIEKGRSDMTQFQPWWFFVERLAVSSPLSLLAIIPLVAGPRFARYLALQGLLSLITYSLIPYKTPWILMSVAAPLLMALALQVENARSAVICALAAIGSFLAPHATDYLRLNDSSEDVRVISNQVRHTCRQLERECTVFIGVRWYWPLPFYLHDLGGQVVYANQPKPLPIGAFDVVILPEGSLPIAGWNRRTYRLSRVQGVTVYWR